MDMKPNRKLTKQAPMARPDTATPPRPGDDQVEPMHTGATAHADAALAQPVGEHSGQKTVKK